MNTLGVHAKLAICSSRDVSRLLPPLDVGSKMRLGFPDLAFLGVAVNVPKADGEPSPVVLWCLSPVVLW
jgi:hypothetical protein